MNTKGSQHEEGWEKRRENSEAGPPEATEPTESMGSCAQSLAGASDNEGGEGYLSDSDLTGHSTAGVRGGEGSKFWYDGQVSDKKNTEGTKTEKRMDSQEATLKRSREGGSREGSEEEELAPDRKISAATRGRPKGAYAGLNKAMSQLRESQFSEFEREPEEVVPRRADVLEIVLIVLELIWTIIKLGVENLRCICKTFLPPEPKDIRGEVTLITGAGHGMGREMAMRFAKLGAVVVCVDINAKGNEETVQMVKNNSGKAHRYECDVTDRAAVFSLAEKITKEVGEVTILVNNAGIMPIKPILEWTEQKIRSTIDVNVTANLWMIQAFLPAMRKRNHGHIVAMSSIAGLMGFKNLVPYCGTKYAVRGIMEALENELHDETDGKSNIKFTTVCPYMVNTGLCKNPRVRFQNLMKMVEPGEAADLIVDAVRRDAYEITIPASIHYANRFFGRLISPSASRISSKFVGTTVEPHD